MSNIRTTVLEAAQKITAGSRHGKPEDTFAKIAALWEAYLGYPVTPHDVAMMMALLKVARARNSELNPCLDNYIDMAGYAACAAELADITEA